MRNILILGAGKSSIALIDYLVQHAPAENWTVTVADLTEEMALMKTKGRSHTRAVGFNSAHEATRRHHIAGAHLVVSMLPAVLHTAVATDCLLLKKHLVTPSYISPAMQAMHAPVKEAGLVFMNEMGLDPGIDHLSAMQILDRLRAEGNTILGFQSHCGGLVAPESDNNPWHYKFTWNPRNVILAGQGDGGIHYLKNGEAVNIAYEELFNHTTTLHVEGHGVFESYPNRDSLKYLEAYGLQGVQTLYRGTLRVPPFCQGWSSLVQMGLTRDAAIPTHVLQQQVQQYLNQCPAPVTALMDSIGLTTALQKHSNPTINPAAFLQTLLEEKWKMQPTDKDMIVMVHNVTYRTAAGEVRELQSWLVYKGTNAEHTAMATTVGLPVAMAARMILNGNIAERGVLMPLQPTLYNPILTELQQYGIQFKESGDAVQV